MDQRRLRALRAQWQNTGERRPDFAQPPGPGQESVWDYPRPPRLAKDTRRVQVRSSEGVIAHTRQAVRVLETASPPTFYLPPSDIDLEALVPTRGTSFCEWKGSAQFWSLRDITANAPPVAWSYPEPFPEFAVLTGHISFFPGRIACFVDDERVRSQPGGFYGGWVTDDITGPFKGEPGTGHW